MNTSRVLSFQDLIRMLNEFWSQKGCLLIQQYDAPMGAATLHPATVFAPSKNNWNVAYVQPCRRPADGRFLGHPNRMQHFYQYQVLLKPVPNNLQELFIESLEYIGISCRTHDLHFIHDDWKSPSLGAFGLGWECTCNGMEITQITYMKQIAGIVCKPHIGELAYGLERVALILQDIDKFADIIWSNNPKTLYKDIYGDFEKDCSKFNFEGADVEILKNNFNIYTDECKRLVNQSLYYSAFDYCLFAIHAFNILDSRGSLSSIEREAYISKTQEISGMCIKGACKKNSAL